MDFTITEDPATLTQGVRDYLAGVHTPELLRALDASESRRSADVWQGLTDMGLPGLLVPEAQGGLGLSLLDAVLIAAELGRAGVAEPLADTALVAAPLLAKAGGQDGLLAAIAAGEAKVALQHPVNPWVADLDGASHILSTKDDALRLSEWNDKTDLLDSVDPLRRLYAPVAADGTGVGSADTLLDHAALIWIASALHGSAREHGFPSDTWTNSRVRELIGRQFGVHYSRVYTWQIVSNLGLGHRLSKSAR